MVEQKEDKTKIIKEVKKEIEQYSQSKPIQLSLFEITSQSEEKYSNTVGLYDLMPKYHFGGVARKMGQYLDILKREFKHIKQDYKLTISPAAILDKEGKTIHYYPSQREELVEDALRRILAVKKKGIYLDNDAAVRFTLYELQQELKSVGHGYDLNEIKQAIEICNRTFIEITSKDGNEVAITSAIFPFVGKETSDKLSGGKNEYVVMFHPLVTNSIDKNTHRRINYEKVMSYKMNLSRWLHKRISHNFTQASTSNTYTPNLNTIVRDSGMKEYDKKNETLRQVCKSLDELVKFNTLSGYKVNPILEGRKIIDAALELYVSDEFVAEIKKANKAKNEALEFISSEEFTDKVDKIEKELEQSVYGLSKVVILNILSKIKTKEDCEIITNALVAAKEFIESKPECNAAATTRAAIRDGWKPKNQKVINQDIKSIEIKEEEKIIFNNEDEFWKKLVKILKEKFDKELYKKWLSKMNFVELKDNNLVVGVESKFLRDWINREYKDQIVGYVQEIDEAIDKVAIIAVEN